MTCTNTPRRKCKQRQPKGTNTRKQARAKLPGTVQLSTSFQTTPSKKSCAKIPFSTAQSTHVHYWQAHCNPILRNTNRSTKPLVCVLRKQLFNKIHCVRVHVRGIKLLQRNTRAVNANEPHRCILRSVSRGHSSQSHTSDAVLVVMILLKQSWAVSPANGLTPASIS